MIFSTEVRHEPRNNQLVFEDDLDYDLDPNYDPNLIRISQICMKRLSEVCIVANPLNCENDPDYDTGSGFQSLISLEIYSLWLTVFILS